MQPASGNEGLLTLISSSGHASHTLSNSHPPDIIPDLARVDDGACRFIQKRFRFGNEEEIKLGLTAALSSLEDLLCDHFGNFMLQGLFEFGTAEMKKELMDAIYGQDVVAVCLHMHG